MHCATFILIQDTFYYDTFLSITCFLVVGYASLVCIAAMVTVPKSNAAAVVTAVSVMVVILILALIVVVVVYYIKRKCDANNSRSEENDPLIPVAGKHTML